MKAKLDSSSVAYAAVSREKSPAVRSRNLNVMSSPRASSAEPARANFPRVDFRKPGLIHPGHPGGSASSPAAFSARLRQRAARPHSRSPATERAYRRATHAAEQAVWDAIAPTANAQLRAAANAAVRTSPGEQRAFAIVFGLAMLGITWGLNESFHFVENWDGFVAALRALLP